MKIQRGIVKYKDRNDIVCTYALTDDGKQYYFLDETDSKRISNGNRIATTALVEAIDPMVKASNIGVIDQNGVVVVPFENRSIRLANDNILIIEKAVPTSQSVLDAIELRNDPNAATKLVSTPASIKDRLKAQMGVEGNYLFNDQFSEATICDVNGTNLVQGENYSFIAMANDRLYLSKNVLDAPISEFSLTTYELTTSQPVAASTEAIDVSAAAVDQQVVEGALNSGAVAVQESIASSAIAANDPIMPSVPVVPEAPLTSEVGVEHVDAAPVDASVGPVDAFAAPVDSSVADVSGESNGPEKEDVIHEVIDTPETEEASADMPIDETPSSEGNTNENGFAEDMSMFSDGVVSPAGEASETELDTPPIVEEEKSGNDVQHHSVDSIESKSTTSSEESEIPNSDITSAEHTKDLEAEFSSSVVSNDAEESNHSNHQPVNIDAETVFATLNGSQNDNIDKEEGLVSPQDSENHSRDTMLGDVFKADATEATSDYGLETPFEPSYNSTPAYDSYDPIIGDSKSYESYGLNENDHLISDVARSMSALMKQNKEQRVVIDQYRSRIKSIERSANEKLKDQAMRTETLSSKLRSMEEAFNRANTRNQLLETKVRDQDKEIQALRSQVAGKQDLARLLADARALLGNDTSDYYNDGSSYFGGRVA